MDYVFGDCLTQGHKDFSYVYSQSSIVFIFIFRYMIHFELICMFDIRNGLKYYFFYKFIEKITFAPFAEKYIDQMGIDLFWDFLFWCIYLFIYFGVNATLLLLLSNKSLRLGCLVFLKVIFIIICPL